MVVSPCYGMVLKINELYLKPQFLQKVLLDMAAYLLRASACHQQLSISMADLRLILQAQG
jgi:hypothetical protein